MEVDVLEDIIIKKLNNNEELNHEEREFCVFSLSFTEEVEEQNRWDTPVRSIFNLDDRLWAIDWSRANTEYQENSFFEDPFEVKAVEKTIVITEYVPI